LNRTAFQQQYDVIWGAHEWPADAVLPVSYEETLGNSALSTKHVPVHDADAIWDTITGVGSDRKIWVGIAPRSLDGILARIEENNDWNLANGDEVRAFNLENKAAIKAGTVQRKKLRPTDLEWMRGTKTECYELAGFALDLDVSMESSEHDEHKLDKPADGKAAKVFPSREAADKWLEDCPIRYTLKIWTGGGYHVWYAMLSFGWGYGNRALMGTLSEDRKWIHVPANSLNSAVKLLGIPARGAQLEGYLTDLVRPGTKPNTRASSDLGLLKPVRGYTFSVEDLELDLAPVPKVPVTPAPPVRPAPVPVTIPVVDGEDEF
jgi:hypothetical protein